MNLKEFREQRQLKQKDMQQILEMNNISQYQELEKDIENGKILSIKHALLLAKHFKLSLDEIYGITKEEQAQGLSATISVPITPLEEDLLEIFRTIGENLGVAAQEGYLAIGESIAKNSK